ncbi:MAG: SpoIIE family protein phosphatase [Acidimicrobiales bacterium]
MTGDAPAHVPAAQALLEVDWDATPLGPRHTWPSSLETMVRVLLGSKFSMWMAWGPELTFFCNDAYARDTLGVKYPWALGRPASTVWAEIWHDIGPRIEQVLRTGEATWDEDLRLFLERSGYREETYHTFSYSPLFDGDAIVGMLCVVSEETERVLGERRMRTLRDLSSDLAVALTDDEIGQALERRFSANAFDAPFTITSLVDEHGRPQLLAHTGCPDGHPPALDRWPFDGMRIGEQRTVGDLTRCFDEVPTGAWDMPPSSAVIVALGEAGHEVPSGHLVAGVNPYRPLDDEVHSFLALVAGRVSAAVANARAFTAERRRAEALAELDRAKTTFFTNISHEFRTPLTLILSPLEDLLRDAEHELAVVHRDRIDVAHRNALRMLKLVNALLDFARIEGGHLTATLEPVDLGALTGEIAGMFRSAIEGSGLEFVVRTGDGVESVLVDPHMWELIVTNLVSNAYKHTFDGGISVRLERMVDRIELSVRDTGTGIPPSELPQLFGRFHRVEGSASRSHEGSGVGLSLVQDLVRLHDGTIHVESAVGTGTEFVVSIPHRPATHDLADVALDPGRRERRSRTVAAHVAEVRQWSDDVGGPGFTTLTDETAGVDRAERPSRILVVDDNADMRGYMTRLLADRYDVRTAVDGFEALALVAELEPDLIISDVMMPRVDGLELVRRVRADRASADTPVILLSARAGAEASIEGLEVGADDYLVKPFSADEFLGRVAARLGAGADRRRARLLAELNDHLVDLHELTEIAEACHTSCERMFGHDQTVVASRSGDQIASAFFPPLRGGIGQRYHTIGVDSDSPLALATVDGVGTVAAGADRFAELHPGWAHDHAAAGLGAVVIRPVTDSVGSRLGALTIAWAADRVIDHVTIAAIDDVAAIVGRALERLAFAAREREITSAIQHQLLEIDQRTTLAAIATRYRPGDPTMIVGGDWYDAFTVGTDRLGVAVGDVVGRGLPAALVMGQLRSALAATAAAGVEPNLAMSMVDAFTDRLGGASCATATYAVLRRLEEGDTELRWCSAGHPPPVVATDAAALLWDGRRAPLGIPPDGTIDVGSILLPPASLLVLYTDGLVERRGESLDVGLERLRAAVELVQHLPVSVVCDELIARLRPEGVADDLVVVAVRTAGATDTDFVEVLPADPVAWRMGRRHLREWLAERRLPATVSHDVLLAIDEAAGNAIEHGSPSSAHTVTVEVSCTDHRLVACVSDSGTWQADSARSTRLGRGRGLQIMEHLATIDIQRSPTGSTVLLEFDLSAV